jgi:hypothetical protein
MCIFRKLVKPISALKIYIKRYNSGIGDGQLRVISICRWTLLYECRFQAGVQNDYETYMSNILCCSSINLCSLVVQLYTYCYNNNELGNKKKSICQSWKDRCLNVSFLCLLLCNKDRRIDNLSSNTTGG